MTTHTIGIIMNGVTGRIRFLWTLLEGAKGVQLAELGLQSWHEKKWLDVPPL